MSDTMIEISNLRKTYPHQTEPALKDISFKVAETEQVGIIGANGSGKTTLFRLILNFIRPDSGEIRIMGESDLERAKKHVGFVPEHQEGLENFTPQELLISSGRMSRLPNEIIKKRAEELLLWSGLDKSRNQLLGSFSKGMVQRLQLALALVHKPKILLLDEPMSGLDPAGQQALRGLLKGLEGFTMLYTSHNLSDVENFCDRVMIFHQGSIIKDLQLAGQETDIFTIETEPAFLKMLEKFPEIEIRSQVQNENGLKIEFIARQSVMQDLIAECKKENISIRRLRSRSILDDLYGRYVKNE